MKVARALKVGAAAAGTAAAFTLLPQAVFAKTGLALAQLVAPQAGGWLGLVATGAVMLVKRRVCPPTASRAQARGEPAAVASEEDPRNTEGGTIDEVQVSVAYVEHQATQDVVDRQIIQVEEDELLSEEALVEEEEPASGSAVDDQDRTVLHRQASSSTEDASADEVTDSRTSLASSSFRSLRIEVPEAVLTPSQLSPSPTHFHDSPASIRAIGYHQYPRHSVPTGSSFTSSLSSASPASSFIIYPRIQQPALWVAINHVALTSCSSGSPTPSLPSSPVNYDTPTSTTSQLSSIGRASYPRSQQPALWLALNHLALSCSSGSPTSCVAASPSHSLLVRLRQETPTSPLSQLPSPSTIPEASPRNHFTLSECVRMRGYAVRTCSDYADSVSITSTVISKSRPVLYERSQQPTLWVNVNHIALASRSNSSCHTSTSGTSTTSMTLLPAGIIDEGPERRDLPTKSVLQIRAAFAPTASISGLSLAESQDAVEDDNTSDRLWHVNETLYEDSECDDTEGGSLISPGNAINWQGWPV